MIIKPKLIAILIIISFCWQQLLWADRGDTLRPVATANVADADYKGLEFIPDYTGRGLTVKKEPPSRRSLKDILSGLFQWPKFRKAQSPEPDKADVLRKKPWPRAQVRPLSSLTWQDSPEVEWHFWGVPAINNDFTRFRRHPDAKTLEQLARGQEPGDYFESLIDIDDLVGEKTSKYEEFRDAFMRDGVMGTLWFLYGEQLEDIAWFVYQLLEENPSRTITILNYGTGNGEEALSIALYLLIRFKNRYRRAKFRVIGKDNIKPEPKNMNCVLESDMPDIVKDRSQKYFIPISDDTFVPKLKFINLAELSQGDIRNSVKENIDLADSVDIFVANNVLGSDVSSDKGLDDALAQVALCLRKHGRLFACNKYCIARERGDFTQAMAHFEAKGIFREVKRDVYEKVDAPPSYICPSAAVASRDRNLAHQIVITTPHTAVDKGQHVRIKRRHKFLASSSLYWRLQTGMSRHSIAVYRAITAAA